MTMTEGRPVETPRQEEPEPFGPGSILWDTIGLYSAAFGGNAAFILQSMHPTIGTVVDQLSSFRTDPVGRAARSFASVQTWVYGGQEAIAEGKRLREMHKPLSAVDENGVTHHALNGEAWAWVHLTGFYAGMTAGRYFSTEPMTPQREQQIFDEFMHLGRILRVPERLIPKSIPEYWAYFDDMVENTLVGHRVAKDVLEMMDQAPPGMNRLLRRALGPVSSVGGKIGRFVTTGTLPPAAREKLGLKWSDADERRLVALGRMIARVEPTLPERVRYMPIAYRAREAARAQARLEKALVHRPI